MQGQQQELPINLDREQNNTFIYDISDGDSSTDLDITSTDIQLNGGTIKDDDSDIAVITFPLAATGRHFSSMYTIQVDTETPTVTLSSSDSDNIDNLTQTVSITATFNKDMQSTPTITIPSVGTFDMSLTTTTTWYCQVGIQQRSLQLRMQLA